MIITWLTRYGEVIGTVRALAAQYSAGVDGTDELTLLTTDQVEKGQRLMWRDDNDRITGLVHEMIVSSARTVHDKRGKALTEVKAINSIAELYWTDVPKQSGLYVPHYTGQTDSEGNPIQNGYILDDLMEGILDSTRWEWVDGSHFDIGGAIAYVGMRETYDVSVREIIAAAAAGFNGAELRTYVFADYDTCEVTHRYVSIAYPLPGSSVSDTQTRGRFTYSKNLTGVVRDVGDSECYTAVRVIGADITDPDTGEVTGRHEVYLETQNAAQLQAWGKPMPDGTVGHSVYTVTTSEESDATLMAMAAETLEEVVTPDVTYTVDVADMEGIRLREYVDTVDEDLGIRIRARVTSIKQDLLDETRGGQVTFGKTMNYAAVATSYQTQNVVTASSNTDTAKTNRVASSGRSGDSTSARVSTAERQIADLNERISGGGGGLSWPIIADKSWWNSDDSFAFFNKGHQWGLTGKGSDLGVYAMSDGLTPNPSSQQWGEGSEIWKALSGTDARTGATGFFLHAVNAAAQFFRFTSNPTTSHIFAKLIDAGIKTTNGLRALAFCYSGHSTTSGSTTTDVPFLTVEPRSGQRSGFIMKTPTPQAAANGFLNGLVDFLSASASSSSASLVLKNPGSLYNLQSGGTPMSRGWLEFSTSGIGSSAETSRAHIALHGTGQTANTEAHLSMSAGGDDASASMYIYTSSSSISQRGIRVKKDGIYAFQGSSETLIHAFS